MERLRKLPHGDVSEGDELKMLREEFAFMLQERENEAAQLRVVKEELVFMMQCHAEQEQRDGKLKAEATVWKEQAMKANEMLEKVTKELQEVKATKEKELHSKEKELKDKDSQIDNIVLMLSPLEKTSRNRIVQEIIDTEISYVDTLKATIDHYMTPLLTNGGLVQLKEEHVRLMFRNLPEIYDIHSQFLKNLQDEFAVFTNIEATQLLGELIHDFLPRCLVYEDYINKHLQAASLLTALVGSEAHNQLLKLQESNIQALGFNGQNLSSCLITPIQRIPRYRLLVTQLLKHTKDSHPDYASLNRALNKIVEIADKLNESLRRAECIEVMKTLKGVLDDPSLIVVDGSRSLVHKGTLRKGASKSRSKKYVVYLFTDYLVYGHASSKTVKIHNKIPIDSTFVITEQGDFIGNTGSPTTVPTTGELRPERGNSVIDDGEMKNQDEERGARGSEVTRSRRGISHVELVKWNIKNSVKNIVLSAETADETAQWRAHFQKYFVKKAVETESGSPASPTGPSYPRGFDAPLKRLASDTNPPLIGDGNDSSDEEELTEPRNGSNAFSTIEENKMANMLTDFTISPLPSSTLQSICQVDMFGTRGSFAPGKNDS